MNSAMRNVEYQYFSIRLVVGSAHGRVVSGFNIGLCLVPNARPTSLSQQSDAAAPVSGRNVTETAVSELVRPCGSQATGHGYVSLPISVFCLFSLSSRFNIFSSIVTLIPSGLPSWILTCTELKGHCCLF